MSTMKTRFSDAARAGLVALCALSLAMAFGAGCTDDPAENPGGNTIIETGYLSCATDASCPEGALCSSSKGAQACLPLPDACAGKVDCACLGATVCAKDTTCIDGADGSSLSCESAADTCTPGETFEASDGCNTCTCPPSGKKTDAACTAMACVYDPCQDKACGDECNPCDPNDATCGKPGGAAVPVAPTWCNAASECVSDDPASLGCEGDPDACTPGDLFDAPDGCNTCTCPASGKKSEAGCTEMACPYDPCLDVACGDACSVCDPSDPSCVAPGVITVCNKDGQCVADAPALLGCDGDPDACTPGESFDAEDGCNSCVCPASGKKSEAPCTTMACQYLPCEDKACGDECTVCDPSDPNCASPGMSMLCNAEGLCVAEAPNLLGCDGDPDACTPGETFDAPDGCNTCTCTASGKKSDALCTLMACLYDPCLDKACGDTCSVCDPTDPNCIAPAVLTVCNAVGQCVSDPPAELGCDPVVQCTGAFDPIFPAPDKSCATDDECTVVFHQINCCGTMVAWGINTSAEEDFLAAEKICQGQYPGCGCATMPTEAEDGNTGGWDAKYFTASCEEGSCKSAVVSGCNTANDCDPSQICLAPGEPLGCGMCMAPQNGCASDADCGDPSLICEQSTIADCLCSPAMVCKPGCVSDAACGEGNICDADLHCAPAPCNVDADCPDNFGCGPAGTCKRSSCTTDWDCPGFCVKGQCYPTFGMCSYLPA